MCCILTCKQEGERQREGERMTSSQMYSHSFCEAEQIWKGDCWSHLVLWWLYTNKQDWNTSAESHWDRGTKFCVSLHQSNGQSKPCPEVISQGITACHLWFGSEIVAQETCRDPGDTKRHCFTYWSTCDKCDHRCCPHTSTRSTATRKRNEALTVIITHRQKGGMKVKKHNG